MKKLIFLLTLTLSVQFANASTFEASESLKISFINKKGGKKNKKKIKRKIRRHKKASKKRMTGCRRSKFIRK